MNLEDIFNKYLFDEADKNFIKQAQTATTADMNLSRVVAEIILSKKIEEATSRIIKSNETLAASNEKYSQRLLWLTGALVFVGVMQIIIKFIELNQ